MAADKSQDDDRRQYIEKEDKENILALIHQINVEKKSGNNSWIISHCEDFNPEENNHLSAFVKYLQDEYPPGCTNRKRCNTKIITAAQVTSWITAQRKYAKKVNEKFSGTPGWGKGMPQIEYLKDTLTDAQREAKKAKAKLEREKSAALAFMKMLKS